MGEMQEDLVDYVKCGVFVEVGLLWKREGGSSPPFFFLFFCVSKVAAAPNTRNAFDFANIN